MGLAEQRTEERPPEQGNGIDEVSLGGNSKRRPSGSQQEAQRTKATQSSKDVAPSLRILLNF